MIKVYLDTNVILDALASREPWKKDAERILEFASIDIIQANVSASSITDIFYLLRKELKDTEKSKEIISKLLGIVHVLDVTQEDCINALASHVTDFEDAVVEQVAKRHEIAAIVTRNTKDFVNASVKCLMPAQLLELLEKE